MMWWCGKGENWAAAAAPAVLLVFRTGRLVKMSFGSWSEGGREYTELGVWVQKKKGVFWCKHSSVKNKLFVWGISL